MEMEHNRMQENKVGSLLFPWFALHVRSRQEVGVANHLQCRGYEFLLPTYKCRKRWSDRIKEVDTPLFPGYLFCRFDPQNLLPIIKTPGVLRIVGYNRSLAPVDDLQINAIQTLMASGVARQPWPFLDLGDRVKIEAGPLRGLEGILVNVKGDHRLVLSVTLLQRSVAVEIDAAFVASVGPSAPPCLEGPKQNRTCCSLLS
jgi:transcription antitermination factor NusG